MTVSKGVEAEIRRLHVAEQWPVGTIASQLGVHADVVRRVLRQAESRPPAARRARLVDPYVKFIDDTLKAHPRLRATRIYDMVKSPYGHVFLSRDGRPPQPANAGPVFAEEAE